MHLCLEIVIKWSRFLYQNFQKLLLGEWFISILLRTWSIFRVVLQFKKQNGCS